MVFFTLGLVHHLLAVPESQASGCLGE